MHKELIKSASQKLRINDIVLHKSTFSQVDDLGALPAIQANQHFYQQNKVSCFADEVTVNIKGGDPMQILRVFVDLGVRAMSGTPENPVEDENGGFLFMVEALYRAEYIQEGELTDDEVREFSDHNAVHNVWPFWRMHVLSTLKQANLPLLNIPLQRLASRKK